MVRVSPLAMADSVEDMPTVTKQEAERQKAVANQDFRAAALRRPKSFKEIPEPKLRSAPARAGIQKAVRRCGRRKGKPRFPGYGGIADIWIAALQERRNGP